MKTIIWFTGFFLFLALIVMGAMSCQQGQTKSEINCDEQLITVFNPAISSEFAERAPLTPRTGSLEGKTIYLVDLQWGGPEAGYSVFEEMKEWFSRNMPSVKTELRSSQGSIFTDDPVLWSEIKENGDAAIFGVGG